MDLTKAKQLADWIRGDKSDSVLCQSDRLKLLQLFGDRFTVKELSEILDVSQRQIYRDRKELEPSLRLAYRNLDVTSELMTLHRIVAEGKKDLEEIECPKARILARKRIVDSALKPLTFIFELKSAEYLDVLERIERGKALAGLDEPS